MSASTLCLCVLRQAKTHAQVERASKKITVAGTGFFETKHQLEQQFGLPSVGKETLHDVSASATKPASADAKNVDQKTSLFGIPKGA